jgi:hypothetical protein
MDLQERLVSAVMGAIGGAVLGFVAVMLMRHHSYSLVYWRNMIVGSSALFAVLGFVFKSSIGTVIGTLINIFITDAVQDRGDHIFSGLSFWIKAIIVALIAGAIYWYLKA